MVRLIRLLVFGVSFVVTMTMVAALLAQVVSYEAGAQQPSLPLNEREHDKTLVQRIEGGIETDGSRAPGSRHQAIRARLP